jgi:predicted TIM-barrel fold metal-dependent hydrolase
MQTPWGDIEVADAHVHFFSHSFFKALAAQKGQPDRVDELITQLAWEAPPVLNAELGKRWAQELDRYEVSRSILMSSIPDDEVSASEAVRAFPDHFYGYFMFNPKTPDASGRAARAFDQLGMRGLCLFPAMHRFSIQDEILQPVFEEAEKRRNVVIFVHTGVLTVGVRKKLGLASKFDMSRSNPMDLHRVAMDYPNLNFVIPHFGAGYFREALMLGDLAPNVHMDTSGSNSWIKYSLPDITLKDVFRKALEVYGPNRLLFGSDSSFFPRGWNRSVFDTQVSALRELNVDEETARLIFAGNLRRLLDPM